MIKLGSKVSVHYTGKLLSGEVFDSSNGKEPLQFTIGSGNIIPGFEEAIIGKEKGDKVNITIESKDAYGDLRDDLIVQVPLDNLPGDVHVGQSLNAVGDDGNQVPVYVREVNESHALIDGNHPLSGKDLVFDIEVVDIL